MSSCQNCGVKMGCSCQRKVATDGKSCCGTCIAAYEAKLKSNKASTPASQKPNSTAPTNVNVFYNAPK